MKLSTLCAQMIIYDDDQYLDLAIEPLLKYTDRILILCNTKPFNTVPGKVYDNSAMREKLAKLAQDEPKILLEVGSWATEEEERQWGVERAKQLGYTYSLIVDTDEIYEPADLFRLNQILENNEQVCQGYWIFHATWKTYWKMDPPHVINPPEAFNPIICVRNANAQFVHLRHAVPLEFSKPSPDANKGRVTLPKELVTLHHMSYARTDEFIERKCQESGHSANGDLMANWFEEVWKVWNPSLKNLHPINGPQYQKATEVDLNLLPSKLKTYFEKKMWKK